jgi:hypothetical protein
MTSDALDPAVPVVCTADAPQFAKLLGEWPDQRTAFDCVQALHRRDLDRASLPPVINVTVAGIPGQFSHVAGTDEVAYTQNVALPRPPEPGA